MNPQVPAGTHTATTAVEVWEDVVGPKYLRHRQTIVGGTLAHGREALRRFPAPIGARVLDVGTGTGESALLLGTQVGPTGRVLGIDSTERFLAVARDDLARDGATNVEYERVDVSTLSIEPEFDLCFSQFGTMFFELPGAAFRDLRRAIVPGGDLMLCVWRSPQDNDWLEVAKRIAQETLGEAPSDAPSCGPGPWSMADPEMVRALLTAAGFTDIRHDPVTMDIPVGPTVEEAAEFALDLGPAGEIVRLCGADSGRERVRARLVERFARDMSPEGVQLSSGSWIVRAKNAV